MTKELKFYNEAQVQLGIDADETTQSGLIEATFTTWGKREGADGRKFFYKAEPFKEWAAALAESGKPLPMYFQHNDESLPVGEWTEFEFDDKGMSGKGRLFTNTSVGKDLYTVMKESPNLVGGVSVGAYADEYCMVDEEGNMLAAGQAADEGYFQITKGGLREVSIVMQPNNLDANINKLEFYQKDGTLDLRVLENALRDAGVSSRNAVVAASVFKKVQEQRDVALNSLNEAPVQRDSDVEATDALLAALEQRELVQKLNKRLKG
jgi:HK97 family phage prohead protease